jgi:hypothetical protein
MAYPTLDELEIRVRAGSAVAVIVEGESIGDDAWVYGDIWFGDRAREVRFLPQDGWNRVVDAISQLRARMPGFPIFGIIDRDFTPDDELSTLEPSGVYRSRLYSVENYLLEPDVWYEVLSFISRIRGGLPEGWRSAAELEAQVSGAYGCCLARAAFNKSIAAATRAHPGIPNAPTYIRDSQDERHTRAADILREWGRSVGLPDDLAAEYERTLPELEAAPLGLLPTLVDGKLVMQELINRFQRDAGGRGYPREEYLNLYLRDSPTPPDEVRGMVERLLSDADAE